MNFWKLSVRLESIIVYNYWLYLKAFINTIIIFWDIKFNKNRAEQEISLTIKNALENIKVNTALIINSDNHYYLKNSSLINMIIIQLLKKLALISAQKILITIDQTNFLLPFNNRSLDITITVQSINMIDTKLTKVFYDYTNDIFTGSLMSIQKLLKLLNIKIEITKNLNVIKLKFISATKNIISIEKKNINISGSKDDEPINNKIQDSANKQNNQIKSVNILIIDDEESCLTAMQLLLHNSGYILHKANGGKAGLKYLIKNSKLIDLVLLDLMMPDLYGLNILVAIKSHNDLKSLPIIIQSGTSNQAEIAKAYTLGIAGYIKKPYNKDLVMQVINQTLIKYR